jgi:hypothetical protein
MWNDVWKPVAMFFGFVLTGMLVGNALVLLAWWLSHGMSW